ncbi:MAG: hypothetical protein DBY00_07040 [Flavobacteriales bacterium]|nr:MAG: hypothetical protein DBY00_07040 [Flavobacteriales bacterium]
MIQDLFFYFAKFPDISGVKSMFTRGESSVSSSAYSAMLRRIDDLPEHSLLPQIEKYIFSASDETIKTHLGSISGTYLFVDYGDIRSYLDDKNRINDEFQCAVTIATRCTDTDLVEQLIYSAQNFELLSAVRRIMRSDDTAKSWVKKISATQTLSPEFAANFQSIGWSMVFTITGYDLARIREQKLQ